MPCRRASLDGLRQLHQLTQPRLLVVAPGGATSVGPRVEVGQLHPQDRGLQLVEATVVADLLVADLVVGAVEAQHSRALRDLGIGGGDHASVAEAPEVLGGEEGERRGGSEGSGGSGGGGGSRGLGSVNEYGYSQRHISEA